MSGYLQRLAARSLGAPATASALPRLPARFESPGGGDAGLEVVDAELTVRGAPQATNVQGGSRPSDRPRATADSAAPAPRARRSSAGARATAALPPATPPKHAAPAARPQSRAAAPDVPGRAPAPVPAQPAAVEVVTASAAVPVAAVPVAQSRPPLAAPRGEPRAAAGAAPEAPVVRVHIGRLEVRANLQPAPAVAPAAAAPEPRREELALSAYLRGERDPR